MNAGIGEPGSLLKAAGLAVLLFIMTPFPCIAGETQKGAAAPFFTWDLYWTGSWYKAIKTQDGDFPPTEELFSGGTLFNRVNFNLGLPRLDLSLRFLASDKRLLPLEDDDGKAGFNPGAGIYHQKSGSRFLYGVQSEYGLPARIKNVWLRSVPFMESRSPSSRDLKTEPAAKDKAETYLYLALPETHNFSVFAGAALDDEMDPALSAGLSLKTASALNSSPFFGGMEMRLEGFYTQKTLPPREISTWFSSAPPLPERDFYIYALAFILNSRSAAFATDWAFSETFAWGRGVYGSFALRLGNKPWRFSLSGDGAGSRFADRSGAAAGAGFRIAAKAEQFRPRSGLFRFQGLLRSPGLDESFNRGNFSFYFRPSAPTAAEKRRNPYTVRFSRASLSLNRDARSPGKTYDRLDALAAFNFGPVSSVFSFALHSVSSLEEEKSKAAMFQFPFFETFDSFKISAELGLKLMIFELRGKLGYTARNEKDSIWEPSINCTVRPGKWGRFSLKIASTDFPEKWNYTLSWRLDRIK